MIDKPVWLEEWAIDDIDTSDSEHCLRWARVAVDGEENAILISAEGSVESARARLAAAAPALVRALLLAEWTTRIGTRDAKNPDGLECPVCWVHRRQGPHDEGCALDAALTAAGLPHQGIRDDARRRIWSSR